MARVSWMPARSGIDALCDDVLVLPCAALLGPPGLVNLSSASRALRARLRAPLESACASRWVWKSDDWLCVASHGGRTLTKSGGEPDDHHLPRDPPGVMAWPAFRGARREEFDVRVDACGHPLNNASMRIGVCDQRGAAWGFNGAVGCMMGYDPRGYFSALGKRVVQYDADGYLAAQAPGSVVHVRVERARLLVGVDDGELVDVGVDLPDDVPLHPWVYLRFAGDQVTIRGYKAPEPPGL